jgi:hypothetical protein
MNKPSKVSHGINPEAIAATMSSAVECSYADMIADGISPADAQAAINFSLEFMLADVERQFEAFERDPPPWTPRRL